jgi:hypothetical protein
VHVLIDGQHGVGFRGQCDHAREEEWADNLLSLRAIALHGIYESNFCIINFKY